MVAVAVTVALRERLSRSVDAARVGRELNHQPADQSNLAGNVPVNAALLSSGSYGGKPTFGKDGVSRRNGGVDESNGDLDVTKRVVRQSESSTQSWKGGEGDRVQGVRGRSRAPDRRGGAKQTHASRSTARSQPGSVPAGEDARRSARTS